MNNPTFRAELLMRHMTVLCKDIGPRPPCSPREKLAAEYVKKELAALGISAVTEQPFKSQRSIAESAVPLMGLAAGGVLLGALGGRLGRLIGGAAWIAGALGIRDLLGATAHPIQRLVATGDSQNVIATIPPSGEVKRRLFLVGHLDTNQALPLFPPTPTYLMRPLNTVSLAGSILGGALMIRSALRRKPRLPKWVWVVGASLVPNLFIVNSPAPHIEGANDNATAVSVLLGVAAALREAPLQHTEVTLLFTGCEEVGCYGLQAYLKDYAPSKHRSYFLDLEMVGAGNIAYVTKHGVSAFNDYRPSPIMAAAAGKAAQKHPTLNVCGRDMVIVEEVAPLVREGYHALCIAGYNAEGYLPNWHRETDQLDRIEPGTLARAAQYTWAVMAEIDTLND